MKNIVAKILSYKEAFLGILIALCIWQFAPGIIRFLDPTSERFDGVYLHALAYGAIGLMFGSAVVMFTMLIYWGVLDRFADGTLQTTKSLRKQIDSFNNSFDKCTDFQKILITLLVFFALLVCFCLLVMSINNGLIQS